MLEAAAQAAHAAGTILRQSSVRRVDHKGAVDLVTEVDIQCEAAVRDALEASTPGVPILAEEGGGAWTSMTRWIVDPLDGTTNFVHGFPFYCVSIALQENGAITHAVLYDPVRDSTFTAQKGHGARVDGVTLRVSDCRHLSDALIASGFAYDRRQRAADYLVFVQRILEVSQGFRRCGSAAMDLAMVASGQLDGYWELNLKPWDVAAGALLVEEAGGAISGIDGGALDIDRPQVLASNGLIHPELERAFVDILDRAPV